MKYRLNTTNYHDFATFAVNKLPARSPGGTDRTGGPLYRGPDQLFP